jgi:hypothetical protein
LNGEEPPVTAQGILYFPRVDFWRYWLAPAASLLVAAIAMFTFVFVVRLIWH